MNTAVQAPIEPAEGLHADEGGSWKINWVMDVARPDGAPEEC
jgi:hypothetical protein